MGAGLGSGERTRLRRATLWFWRIVAVNAPFALALVGLGALPQVFQPLVVGAILFIVPGLAWTDLRNDDLVSALFRTVMVSLVASLATWLALLVLPGPTDRAAFILVLAAITNAGLWFGGQRGWLDTSVAHNPLSKALFVVAALFYVQSYLGAAHFIPPLEDQDMETQGTAYGLINEFTPTIVTNRKTRFFFAHPLLLHFWIGESALISGDIDRLRHYHRSSVAVGAGSSDLAEEWAREYAQFQRDPALLPTRTPNLGLSFLIVFPLGFLAYRLSGSVVAAVGATVLYATLPEVYVRTAYGGYMALTNFLLVTGAYFYLQASGLLPQRDGVTDQPVPARRLGFGAALLAGAADQKGVLLPMAATAHAGLLALVDGKLKELLRRAWRPPIVTAAVAIGLGFVVGWVVFAIYGLSVAPYDFLVDHVGRHIGARLRLHDVRLAQVGSGNDIYPSILALWTEFVRHSGWLFTAAAVPAALYALKRFRQGEGMLLIWVVIGAVGFSLVDWRQTKHLAHILPALVLLTMVYWASLQGRLKAAFGCLLVAAIAWNAWTVVLQMQDFTYIKPQPLW